MHSLRLTIVLSIGIMLLPACRAGTRNVTDRLSQAQMTSSTPPEATPAQPTAALGTFIEARKLAWDAAVMVQHPPHTVETWQAARVKWRQAINLLETIPEGTALSVQAKEKIAVYQVNYAAINDRLTTENNSC